MSNAPLSRVTIPTRVVGKDYLGLPFCAFFILVTPTAPWQVSMAIGSLIGSNVLNILAITGYTSVITDAPVPPCLIYGL